MKRLKDKSDVPKARLGILPRTYTSSKRTTRLHSSRLQKSGFSQMLQQESRRREFVVDSGAIMHMVSKKNLNSAELETMRTSRSPSKVTTANGEVITTKEATENVKQLRLTRHCYASSRNSRSAFIGETLRRTWVHVSLEKRSQSTSHQRWQEN